jgi:hypothetical protein
VDGAPTDLPKVCIDDQQFVEGHGMKEIALHMDAWQPDAEAIKELAIGKTAGTEELHFGQSEEAQISLIVDDAGGIDVFPPDVLLDREPHDVCAV